MSKYLTKKDMKMTEAEFDLAVNSLLSKGLIEELVIDGEKNYRITELGRTVYPHLASLPAERN